MLFSYDKPLMHQIGSNQSLGQICMLVCNPPSPNLHNTKEIIDKIKIRVTNPIVQTAIGARNGMPFLRSSYQPKRPCTSIWKTIVYY